MNQEDKLDLILKKLEVLEAQQADLLLENKLLYRQIEALFVLYHSLKLKQPLANLRGWAASPDFLAIQLQVIRRESPKTILELGSGQTSLISAYALQELGAGHVYALDNSDIFAEATEQNLAAHGLSQVATIIHAPLKAYELKGKTWQWYEVTALETIPPIDLLIVDGPPQAHQENKLVRYPALPLLEKYLAPNALILLDDADRADEIEIAEQWQAEFPLSLLRHYERQFADNDKGAKLFRLNR